jgi:HK97 family phage major capsid protein
MTIPQLHEQRAAAINAAKTLMAEVEASNRALTAEEQETLDRMFADVDLLERKIYTETNKARVAALSKSLEKPARAIATAHRAARDHSDSEYRTAFFNYLKGGDDSEIRALNRGTNADGKFVVPETTEARISELLYQQNVMRRICTVRSTVDDRKIPIESTLGTAGWIAEAGAISQVDVQFGQVTIGSHKAATSIKASREVMDDAVIDLESYVVDKLTLRISRLEEEAYVTGDGTGKPTGVLTSLSAGFTLPNSTSQTLTLANPAHIFDWVHTLKPQYRPGAVILTSDKFIMQLRKLRDGANGTVGAFIWEPAGASPTNAMRDGAAGTIAGIPYYISEFHPQPGGANGSTVSAVVATYGLFRYFEIYDRGRTEMLVDPYTNSLNWQVNIHVVRRSDSKRMHAEPFKTLVLAAS